MTARRLSALSAAMLTPTLMLAAAASGHHASSDGEATATRHPPASKQRTFNSRAPISIPTAETFGKADPYPARIRVRDFGQREVRDVNVSFRGLSHTFPDDIDVMLRSPGGRRGAIVMSDAGGGNSISRTSLLLNDEAGRRLPDVGQLVTRPYRPVNWEASDHFDPPARRSGSFRHTLSTFDGVRANGIWRLYVTDDAGGDAGRMAAGWSLRIRASLRR